MQICSYLESAPPNSQKAPATNNAAVAIKGTVDHSLCR